MADQETAENQEMIIPPPNEEVIVEKPLEFPYVAIKSAPPKEKVEDKSVEAENE